MSNASENKLQKMESFKRLINLALMAGCIGLEIGIFTYNWLNHFQYSLVEDLADRFWFKGHLLEVAIYGVILFFFLNSLKKLASEEKPHSKQISVTGKVVDASKFFAWLIFSSLKYCE